MIDPLTGEPYICYDDDCSKTLSKDEVISNLHSSFNGLYCEEHLHDLWIRKDKSIEENK